MTDRPKLYPGHQHQWTEDLFESTMVRCTVCHFRAPRNAAGLDATVPWEAFDVTHPDHEWWVEQTGRCLAPDCPTHQPEQETRTDA